MFKLSNVAKSRIRKEIISRMSEKDFRNACDIFERFVSINCDDSSVLFTEHGIGTHINCIDVDSGESVLEKPLRVEGFLKKLNLIRGISNKRTDENGRLVDKMLNSLYEDVDFRAYENSPEGIAYKAHIGLSENRRLSLNYTKTVEIQDYFRSDETKYIYEFLVFYQYRNEEHHDNIPTVYVIDAFKAAFIIYFVLCLKYSYEINKKYEEQLVGEVDYIQYIDNLNIEDKMNEFNAEFLQFNWIIKNDNKNQIKYIGPSGTGKTTEMTREYYKCIEAVKNPDNQDKVLPVFVNLFEIGGVTKKEDVDRNIQEIISKVYPDINVDIYDLLLKNNKIVFFLDGYNEILDLDIKRQVAIWLRELLREHNSIKIYMTDRRADSNPSCMENASICEFHGFENEDESKVISEIIEYAATKEKSTSYDPNKYDFKAVEDYLNTEDSKWIFTKGFAITPHVVNCIAGSLKRGKILKEEKEFYVEYLVQLFERERQEKKEPKVEEIKLILKTAAKKMTSNDNGFSLDELIAGLSEYSNIQIEEKNISRLLDVAVEMPILNTREEGLSTIYYFANESYYWIFKNMR